MKSVAFARNQVRIIGGEWRSRHLKFPTGEGLRPTPDSVRETLFNWLGQTLYGKTCLDLFAGSGALGFEALSRGASRVVMVDQSRTAQAALRTNAANLKAQNVEFFAQDALQFLACDHSQYDVIFLDPPYHNNLLPQLWPLLPPHLTADAVVYAEAGSELAPEGWEIWRSGRAGKAHYYLLKWNGHA